MFGIAAAFVGGGIVLPTPSLWKRTLGPLTPQRITRESQYKSWGRCRERPALDRMSPSFARNIATAEDFVPAGASANIQPKRNDAILPRARSSPFCGDHGEALRMTRAATESARSIGLHGILKAATYALELIAVAVAYFGLAVSGPLIPWINPTATPLWPPTGLALALVLLRGYRIWPAIFVGAFFATLAGSGSLSEAACIALGTPVAALAGAWLINRWSRGRDTFATPLGVAKFALIAFAPTAMISAAAAIAGLVLANDAGLASPVAKWTARWLADAGGTLIVAPVIVLWATKPSRAFWRWSLLETAAVIFVTAAIGVAAFSPQVGSALMDSDFYALLPYRSLLAFLVVLPLLWSSLRGNPRDAAAAAPVFCAIAAWGFATSFDLNGSPVLLFALVLATSLPPLILATAIATHQQTTARLVAAQDQSNRQVVETKLAFERSKRHFQILIEGVVDHAVFLLDRSGRVASWNSTAQHIIGYTG